jgi:predicted outer membrane lipoprotein
MSVLMRFIVLLILAVIAILLTVILGDYGPWYLSWLLGTGFMVLVAAMGGVLYEEQEDALDRPTEVKSRSSSGY